MTQKSKKNDVEKVALDEAQMKSVLMEQKDFLVPMVQEAVQTILEVEMEECLQAGKHERSESRLGYRSGYYRRRLITRVGTLVLRVPQDRGRQPLLECGPATRTDQTDEEPDDHSRLTFDRRPSELEARRSAPPRFTS